ncbi:MAG: hypothetical protein K8W52_08555 [Deltaproteobacteria bacterium]|nr:hypothetical protein [Deltaproteobacteria bacterium]
MVATEGLKAPVRWLKAHWADDDVWFFFEADDDGWVLRQVELRGPDETPQVAAALAEWSDADSDGLAAVQAYEAKYGALADQAISAWNDFPGVAITGDEFETVWRRARAYLDRGR